MALIRWLTKDKNKNTAVSAAWASISSSYFASKYPSTAFSTATASRIIVIPTPSKTTASYSSDSQISSSTGSAPRQRPTTTQPEPTTTPMATESSTSSESEQGSTSTRSSSTAATVSSANSGSSTPPSATSNEKPTTTKSDIYHQEPTVKVIFHDEICRERQRNVEKYGRDWVDSHTTTGYASCVQAEKEASGYEAPQHDRGSQQDEKPQQDRGITVTAGTKGASKEIFKNGRS